MTTRATEGARQELAKAAPVRDAGDRDRVGGVPAQVVASPGTTDQVAEVLRVAAQHDLAVVACGSGSKLDWGAPPRRLDVLLDTTGLRGVVEHAAGDLVVVVGAGTPLAELQEAVAAAGQQLALDSPFPHATVGGVLSTATSGPRRLLYGTPRDLLIGVTFVRADGVVAKAGGKVVKNVAGYDFGKLLTGAYGTLGVVTEAVFRLHPLPSASAVVTATYPDAGSAGRAALAVLGSQVVPTAVELDGAPDAFRVTTLVEGVEAGVTARTRAVVDLLGAGASVGDELPADFTALPFTAGDTGLKLTASLTGVGHLLGTAHDLAAGQGLALAVRGSAAGVLHAGTGADADPARVASLVADLRTAAAAYGGTVTVLTAPAEVRDRVDVWGPVPGLDLMRRLKDELDPGHLLAPGRFVGGI